MVQLRTHQEDSYHSCRKAVAVAEGRQQEDCCSLEWCVAPLRDDGGKMAVAPRSAARLKYAAVERLFSNVV